MSCTIYYSVYNFTNETLKSIMINTWNDLFLNLNEYATQMKEFTAKIPKSPVLYKEIRQLEKMWRKIQQNVNKFEKEFNPAAPIIIKIPDEFNSKDFANAWENWKYYLAEQHNITMLTRMEAQSLELLLELSDRDKSEAIFMLKFASGNGYPKFFKVNRNSVNTKKSIDNGENFDPDFK